MSFTISFIRSALITVATCAMANVYGASEKPNFLIILADDLGYATVSHNPLHPAFVSTPNIDSIATSGVTFNQGYITGNVCSPSRAGLLTGRYQQRAQVFTGAEGGRGIAMDNRIIPAFLKTAGYVSGALGKWHLGLEVSQSPLPRGFDEFFGFLGKGAHPYFKLDDGKFPIYRGTEPVKPKGYLTDLLTDEAVSFVKKHKAEPFFLYLAYNAMHTPIEAPEETTKKYADVKAVDPKYQDDKRGPISTYMAMLEHLDKGIGRVLDTLKQEGLSDNTMIIFLSDNGGPFDPEQFNKPLHGNKHENWEGGVRTPFYVSWPKRIKAGQVINPPVISLDILPTMLDVIAQPLPTDKPLDGKSLMPLIEGTVTNLHDQLFWTDGDDGWASARLGDWKMLIHEGDVQLFNLADDPAEKNNVIKKNPEKLAEVKKAFDAWLATLPNPMKKGAKVWTLGKSKPSDGKVKEE